MQEFIIIDDFPYLLHDGKAYAVRWDDKGFTVGGVFREGIAPTDFQRLTELSVMAKCQGRLDSIGKADAPGEGITETDEAKPKRGRKAKGESK